MSVQILEDTKLSYILLLIQFNKSLNIEIRRNIWVLEISFELCGQDVIVKDLNSDTICCSTQPYKFIYLWSQTYQKPRFLRHQYKATEFTHTMWNLTYVRNLRIEKNRKGLKNKNKTNEFYFIPITVHRKI